MREPNFIKHCQPLLLRHRDREMRVILVVVVLVWTIVRPQLFKRVVSNVQRRLVVVDTRNH